MKMLCCSMCDNLLVVLVSIVTKYARHLSRKSPQSKGNDVGMTSCNSEIGLLAYGEASRPISHSGWTYGGLCDTLPLVRTAFDYTQSQNCLLMQLLVLW